MKKIITLIGVILLVSFITAGAIGLILSSASFIPEPEKPNIRYNGNVTFNCGKEKMFVYLDEPNLDIDEDFEEAVRGMCDTPITNIIDWNRREYQQDKNYPECRSFNETKIQECVDNLGVTPNPI